MGDQPQSMLFIDPPDHIRQRRLVSRAFTPRRVEQMRERIAELRAAEAAGHEIWNYFVTLLGAANRDPSHFTEPDCFDIGRDEGTPMSFAAGIRLRGYEAVPVRVTSR